MTRSNAPTASSFVTVGDCAGERSRRSASSFLRPFSSSVSGIALLAFGSIAALSPTAHAQEAPAATGAAGDVVVIQGRRLSQAEEAIGVDETSNTVAVTREALLSAPAGISGLKMLEGLPGFNVQTDGALGLYEFGNSVTVRAFNLQQIGFVLDGIPMGRSDAFGGSPIFRYVDNENLGSVVASPGAGDVSQPSYASLGPIVEYHSIDPDAEFGGTISHAWGDDNLNRSFVKVQTGQIGPFSAYIARSKTDSDLWRGGGYIDREHWEAKAKIELGLDTNLTFKYVSNDFFDYDSPSFTKATYYSAALDNNGERGRYRGYAINIPNLAYGPLTDYPGQTGLTNAGFTDWFEDRINIRNDSLYGATFETAIGDDIDVEATAYYEDKDGYGVSPDGYANTRGIYVRQAEAGLDVTAPRGVQYGLSGVGGVRSGMVAKGSWQVANHKLEGGFWLETDDYSRTQYRLNHAGGIQTGAVLYDQVAYYRRKYESTRETTQIFIKDTISLLDDTLNVELGVKALSIDYQLSGYRDFNDYYRVVGGVGVAGWGPQTVGDTFEDTFLPMAGLLWKLTNNEQVFASYSQNYALPRGTDDAFAIAPASQVSSPAPEAETSENFEVGFRTLQSDFDAAVAVYYTTFENRLETYGNFVAGQAGAVETFPQNVGGVESYGIEFTGAWKPAIFNDQLYFNGNVTYNNTTFQNDIPNFLAPLTGQTARRPLLISGKTLTDSPEWIVSLGATWEPTSWLVANLSAKYQSDRYSNFTNTEEISDYTIVSGYVDLGEGDGVGPLGHFKVRANVDNIFDEDVLAFITPSINGLASFRPQSPRTFSISLTGDF
ncbi:MAG: TonB-dependent receptor [Hyphomonadaceae bacterium]|nr:TonB-dependent receptor [Hyphomonadaceae bacterium]